VSGALLDGAHGPWLSVWGLSLRGLAFVDPPIQTKTPSSILSG
jgi:hypothetical protein